MQLGTSEFIYLAMIALYELVAAFSSWYFSFVHVVKRQSPSSNENGLLTYTYNINGISKYKDEELLFYCYRSFDWLNEHFMLNLINKHCEMGGLEYLYLWIKVVRHTLIIVVLGTKI